MRIVGFSVSESAISPNAPQYAGVQGEHNATEVMFTLPQSWIDAGYAVRAEFVDGTGAFDTTAFLTVSSNTVSVPLPVAWTAAGGLAEIRLAAAKMSGDGLPEETVVYSPVGYLYFDSREGEPTAWRDFENRGLSALIADSLSATEAAETVATLVQQKLESGAFDGKDGSPGEKGEKGDKGDTGAPGAAGGMILPQGSCGGDTDSLASNTVTPVVDILRDGMMFLQTFTSEVSQTTDYRMLRLSPTAGALFRRRGEETLAAGTYLLRYDDALSDLVVVGRMRETADEEIAYQRINRSYPCEQVGLLNKSGQLVSGDTGGWRTTDFIPVNPHVDLHLIGRLNAVDSGFYNIWAYDGDKNPLSGVFASGSSSKDHAELLAIPENAAYVRVMTTSGTVDAWKLVYGMESVASSVNDIANELAAARGSIEALENELREKTDVLAYSNLKEDTQNLIRLTKWTRWGTIQNHHNDGETLIFSSANDVAGSSHGVSSGELLSKTDAPVCLKMHVSIDTAQFEQNTNAAYPRLYIQYTKSDGSTVTSSLHLFSAQEEYETVVDIPHMVVYNDLVSFRFILSAVGIYDITVTGYECYTSGIKDLEIYDKTFEGIVTNVQNKLTRLESGSGESDRSAPAVLATPDGESYLLQLDESGAIGVVPVVPSKILFIGNSLLLGHGGYGMAATDREHDYYYHFTHYIEETHGKTLTTVKQSGVAWEGCTTGSQQNTWLQNTLLPLLSDDLDLVVVQLGDNVNTAEKQAVFDAGCLNMLKTIRKNAPKARVVWVGSWYTRTLMDHVERHCKATGSTFVDIRDLSTDENRSYVGMIYTYDSAVSRTYAYDSFTDNGDNTITVNFTTGGASYSATVVFESYTDDASAKAVTIIGKEHFENTGGMAGHPGNKGFCAIANRMLYQLGIADSEEAVSL